MQKWVTTLDPGSQTFRWRERGKTFSEPAIQIRSGNGRILAVGTKAQEIYRFSREVIELEWPLQCDDIPTSAAIGLLKHFRRKMGNGVFCIAIPDWLTKEEELPLFDIYHDGGFKTVRLVREMEAIRAASGNESDVLYLHLGARRSSMAFFEGTELKFYRSIRWGGDDLDECIRRFLDRELQLKIGSRAARLLKESLGQMSSRKIFACESQTWCDVEFDLATLNGIFDEELTILTESICQMLEKAPQVKSLKLSGGLANFGPLPDFLGKTFGLPISRFTDSANVVLTGLEKSL